MTSSGGASRKGSSPHTRGALDLMTHFTYWKRIIPAYAGSTRIESRAMSSHGDHPRIRGEHMHVLFAFSEFLGSSPHTRGALRGVRAAAGTGRIIPAYAGSTSRGRLLRRRLRDHPRIRGEHTNDAQMEAFSAGSSPHTRGALHTQPSESGPTRIIPAYAGSTWCRWCAIRPGWDHPRIRGEHPPGDTAWGLLPGSSPHTRGARRVRGRLVRGCGIIPAYAGSTCRRIRGSVPGTDHPRIRGEHDTHADG